MGVRHTRNIHFPSKTRPKVQIERLERPFAGMKKSPASINPLTSGAKLALSSSRHFHFDFHFPVKKPHHQPTHILGPTLFHGTGSTRNRHVRACTVGAKEGMSSTDLVAKEYSDLNLTENISGELGHVRIRQHVNPLSLSFSAPAQVPDWKEVYRDPTLPLMVDIGSGSGRFLIWLANKNPDSGNYLGLEIRQKLAKRAALWVKELALDNIHFLFANATVSFRQLVLSYPGPLKLVSILCPDPHFKNRHHKRRVLQKPLVNDIVANLATGGQVFVQSDVHEVAVDMRNQFDSESDDLRHIDEIDPYFPCDGDGWLFSNPMGIRTEREIHAESEGAKIYRRLYQKWT